MTAYQGAISAIQNKTYLPTASGIEAVEVPLLLLCTCSCSQQLMAMSCTQPSAFKNSRTPVTDTVLAGLQGMHAGAIRAFLYNNAQLETPYNVTVAEVTAAISELRNSVGGVTTSAPLSCLTIVLSA